MRLLRLIAPALAAVALAVIPASAAAARTPAVGERIINGSAPTQTWPAQTSVVFSTASGMFECGGTLVSARWVLTAGHCATDDDGSPVPATGFFLRVGGTTRSTGTAATVDTVVRHPGYDATGAPVNDLTLLHLHGAVAQEPMRIVGTDETSLWGPATQATVIGWGVTQSGYTSTTLLQALTPIVGDSTCQRIWGSDLQSTTMVCAGGLGTDTCNGDSGGPLMVPRHGWFTLVGVTSWGAADCGLAGAPGVYARLGAPALNAWVRSLVPAADLTVSPEAPAPGQPVDLTATVGLGSHAASPPPALAWDLDDDGAFDDAANAPTASATFATAGSHVVRVQATFDDGDRAVGREIVTVVDPNAAPPASAPAPAASTAAPQATPEQIRQLQQLLQQQDTPIGTLTVPAHVKLATLRASSVRVRFRCERACAITGRMTLDARAARRFGLGTGAGTVTVGRGSGALTAAGNGAMNVRLTARAKRALRRARHVTIRMATELRGDGAAAVRGTQAVTVTR